jgi:hypothetical protein
MISDGGIRDHRSVMAIESTRKLQTVASAVAGMRRVDCVRMVEEARPRFFVVGIGHRFPVEREVSPAVARALLEDFPCRYERPRRESRVG